MSLSVVELTTKDTREGEVWGVFDEDSDENLPRHSGTALYLNTSAYQPKR